MLELGKNNMAKKNLDTLIEYGISFQIKTISTLLKNSNFLEQIHDIIDPKYYDSDAVKWIVKIILEYYNEYHKVPSMEVFKLELEREVDNDVMKQSIIDKLRSVYNNFASPDLEYVQENFLNFAKNQVMKQAVLDSVDMIQSGNYDEIRSLIDNALRAGEERNIGVIWKEKEAFDRRMAETLRSPIPTPWPVLTEILDGGLGDGDLGVVVAPGGVGKCVGKDTEIEIEYEEIGINILDYTIWFEPWNKIYVNDKYMFVYEFANIISECIAPTGNGKTLLKRLKHQKIKIGDLFNKLNISNEENAQFIPDFYLKVKTPYGYKDIKTLFRTEKQQSVRCYFGNNKTLECSLNHRLKVNDEWKKIKDIKIDNDIIETQTGLTYLKKIHYGKEKILYDISVKDVHCYYSNEILSHNSWCLVAIANYAVTLGKNVIYYTMELNEDYVGLRHDAKISGYASQDVKYHQDDVFKLVNKIRGNLIIKYYPTKNASIDTIRTHVVRAESYGYKPDMIIIDYPDLLKSQTNYSNTDKRFELENIYEHTRGLAGELQIPIWAASQANRASLEDDVIEGGRIAESYNKVMIADFVISLQRKTKDKLAHTGRIHVIKNRFGPDGFTFPSKMNAANGNIELFNEKSDDGRKTKQDTEEGGKLERMKIGEKVDEIKGRKKFDKLV